jgi:hypothetical protein
MLLTTRSPMTNNYPVEASGWDSADAFFVEKSELEWNEETGKYLTLSRSLRPGSTIFLRLLQPTASNGCLPVAYRAQHLGVTSEGQQRFRLNQVQPSSSSKGAPA